MTTIIFAIFVVFAFCEQDCDGEVSTCGACTSSSETFAQCQWCSSSGRCNGKFDVLSDCPNGGQWLFDCSATTGVQASPAPTEPVANTLPGGCQTAAFCNSVCKISGSITLNSVSWGNCCADCSYATAIHSANGYCSNSCLANNPAPPATPATTKNPNLEGT